MEPTFPVFVCAKDSGEIASFRSVHELQAHVEAIDIENDEYDAWDLSGRRVDLTVQEPVWLRLEVRSTVSAVDELRDSLRRFGETVGVDVPSGLPVTKFLEMLNDIRAERAKNVREGSAVRRFFARLKRL